MNNIQTNKINYRRNFIKKAMLSSALISSASIDVLAKSQNSNAKPKILKGNTFNLTCDYLKVNFSGKQRLATSINGSIPAPTLIFKEGEDIVINVTNNLQEDTSIHWHGLILPSSQDGVPFISDGFSGIKPNETFTYKFKANQSGTYWYHSHSGFQEQTGSYGAIIIEPKKYPFSFDRQYIVQLSDWSDESPYDIFAKLKKSPHFYNTNERTLSDFFGEIGKYGLVQAFKKRDMWNTMRMADSDISDVTGATYTFLMNGVSPKDGWIGLFKKNEKILLRVINSAAMTFFDVSIPNLKMTVVSADGQYIQPVSVDEFRIGVAETYDVIIEPSEDMAYTIFAQAIDRSGYARGTLTKDVSVKAVVPKMHSDSILAHADMGMNHSAMNHNDMDMDSMNHSKMNHSKMDHSKMNHSAMNMKKNVMGSGEVGFGSARELTHNLTTQTNIDMIAQSPQYRLDDVGVGLRNIDKKILTYADLKNLYKTTDTRKPTREIDLHLTGNMGRYMWSINGVVFKDAEDIKLSYNERVRINLINHTMMNHPMHLHGMWSELETGDGEYIPKKHTIIVQPGAKISYLLTADAMGGWAYHCHLIYHMPSMFRKITVS